MVSGLDICRLRHGLLTRKGQRVRLTTNKGKKAVKVYEGTIADIYEAVFTVTVPSVKQTEMERRLSFSYTDVITHTIELAFYEPHES